MLKSIWGARNFQDTWSTQDSWGLGWYEILTNIYNIKLSELNIQENKKTIYGNHAQLDIKAQNDIIAIPNYTKVQNSRITIPSYVELNCADRKCR